MPLRLVPAIAVQLGPIPAWSHGRGCGPSTGLDLELALVLSVALTGRL